MSINIVANTEHSPEKCDFLRIGVRDFHQYSRQIVGGNAYILIAGAAQKLHFHHSEEP